MGIHSLNDEIPVEIINRNLLFIKKDLYYNRDESEGKPLYKNGKEYCKKRLSSSKFLKNKYNRKLCYRKMYPSNTEKAKMARERAKKAREERAKKAREERAKKAREEREKKAREERAKKAKEEREKKAKEEREKKAKEEREKKAKEEREKKAKEEREKKAKEEREKKAREDKDNNNNDNKNKDKVGGGDDDGDDNDNNNTNNNNNNNTDNNNNNNDNNDNNDNPTPPELTNAPTNSYQTAAATFSPTSTYMSNASLLPSEDGRQKISVAGISVIAVILVGVIVLVGLAIYRKRNNMRRGAVRLYDEPDQNDSSVMPRYLSSISNMRSLRIPSMPPKVQLTRLSSATILLPFRENNPALSNNNHNNPGPSFNNLNNNYLSPYTKIHPNSPSGGLTVNENRDQNSQKTDSVQSQESYSTLESSFPIPPQRAFNDSYNTTPTSATFGDMYKIKPG